MSEENQNQNTKPDRRYLGKVKNITTKNGTMQKIYMDNLDHQNKDGTPNTFYKGALIWSDAVTGKNYHVKQMSFWVPREGMSERDIKNGNSCFITLNLDDTYEVTILG